MRHPGVDIQEVRAFWEANPVAASAIPHPVGSAEYFPAYDALRELNESPAFAAELHEFSAHSQGRVLDVGAGNGYVLSRYARAGAEVVGVDLTAAGTGLCRRRFALQGLRGCFVQGSGESLPFRDQSFDCVCSMGVIHHTPDPEAVLAECRRVLVPGGRLILMVYHRDSLLYQLRFRAFALLLRRSRQRLVNAVDGAANPLGRVYSRSELRRLLGGFSDVELSVGLLQPWMLPPPLGRLAPSALLARLEKRFGWFLYAKARKARAS
jgi:SAM-dependent methyltransferase